MKGENYIAREEWGQSSAVGTCPVVSKDNCPLSDRRQEGLLFSGSPGRVLKDCQPCILPNSLKAHDSPIT